MGIKSLISGLARFAVRAIPVGLGLVCLFVGQAWLARLVGVEVFGSYGYALTWITGGAIMARAGYEWVLIKNLPGMSRDTRNGAARFLLVHAFRAVSVRAIVAAFVVVGALALMSPSGASLDRLTLFVAAALVLFLAWGGMRRAWGLAYGATWLADTPENIVKPLLVVLVAAIIISFQGAISVPDLIGVNFAVTALAVIIGIALLLMKSRSIIDSTSEPVDLTPSRSLMRAMWLTTVLNMVLRNTDILLIGALTDARTTGLYIAASRLAAIAGTPVTVLDQVVAPRIALAHEAGDKAELRKITFEYGLLAATGCFVFLGLLVFMRSNLVTTVFGDAFAESAPLVGVLLAGHAVNSLTGPSGLLLSMTGSHKTSVCVAAISALALVALLCLLTPKFQAFGAAAAFSAALTIKNGTQVALVVRRLGINPTLLPLPRVK